MIFEDARFAAAIYHVWGVIWLIVAARYGQSVIQHRQSRYSEREIWLLKLFITIGGASAAAMAFFWSFRNEAWMDAETATFIGINTSISIVAGIGHIRTTYLHRRWVWKSLAALSVFYTLGFTYYPAIG